MNFDTSLPFTLASVPASHGQHAGAGVVTAFAFATTLALLPFASRPGPILPGFLLVNQTALLMAYGLGAWVLYAQFWRGQSLSLLLAATASLFTAGMMALQTASFPGVFGPGATRLLGGGPETTTWLWTFWHIGPACLGLAYAATVRRDRTASFQASQMRLAVTASVAGTLGLIAAFGAVSTVLLPWLPKQTNGDDYRSFITSGIGPGLVVFTLASLAVLWRTTRAGRTVLELWIAVSLALLTLDSILTQVGGIRGSIGWYTGRLGALIAALTVLWAYLHEVNATYARAERTAAAERLHIEASLRQAQKMEAIGHLTSGIAHDFGNLLTAIGIALTVIRKHPDNMSLIVKAAETGQMAVIRGKSLTAKLLLFSGRRVLLPELVSLNHVLKDFQAIATHAAPPFLSLTWQFEPNIKPVMLDPVELETALLNLVVNSSDALKAKGGNIVISTKSVYFDQNDRIAGADVSDHFLKVGNYAIVTVSDNGPGMPEGVAAQAFDPFFTTKESGKGTGLGLSQVYWFARSANGLAVIHTGSAGTSIELWLPLAPEQTAEFMTGSSVKHNPLHLSE